MPGLTGAGSESSKVQDAEDSQERPDINSDIGDVPLTNPARDGSAAARSAQGHAKASRKRPLANAEESDGEGAAGDEAAASGAAGTSRRMPVPSRPSGAGTSVRPHGKAVPPEALPSFMMGIPPQAMPLRPSQRDAAQEAQGQAAGQAADVAAKGATLRQSYSFLADPEKQPKLASKPSPGNSGHFDPTNQMILRLEYLSEPDVKWAIFFIHVAEFVGLVVLILFLAAKLETDDNFFIRDNTLVVVNLCFGVLLWLAVMEVFVIYLQHVFRTNRLRRRWSFRRYRTTVVLLAETLSQIINLCFFILPNAYLLVKPCGWRDPIVLWSNFVSWSCWNTLFLVLVVRVHNLNLWLDKDGQPRGGRRDATIIDAPWIVHAPKLLLWAAAEAFKAAATVIILRRSALRPYYVPPGTEDDCRLWLYECHHDSIVQIMLIVESVLLLLYLSLFLFYLIRSFRQLSTRNFRDFRMSNQSVRLILRTRSAAIVFFAASVIIFYYVRLGSCSTWISSELGYLPMHIVMTAIIIVMLYWFMPKDPDAQDQILQAWLQEFAWTEAEKLQKWKARAGNLRLTSSALHELNKEPMFCFESAIKLYYYSHIIYHYDKLEGFRSSGAEEKKDEVTHIGMFRRKLAQSFGHLHSQSGSGRGRGEAAAERAARKASASASGQGLAEGPVTDNNLATGPNPAATAAKLKASSSSSTTSGSATNGNSQHGSRGPSRGTWGQSRLEDMSLDTALKLYGLERMEVLWERRHDTMALIAWGHNRVVVVFRGTNSLKNVLADLEAWQTPFPPNQAGNHFWERPAVHNGFYNSYTANDFGRKIVRRVCEIVSSNDWEWTKIYCTGHSLGGALATLAAYDISRAMEWVNRPTKIICYTFGAPRLGNYAFAETYNRLVPETWNVVNDQDAVARRFKLCFLYKRPGQRVLINRRGDMLVRPTFIELTLNQTPFNASVHDHFLLSYRDALAEICRAQMTNRKRLEGGLAGVLNLLEGDEFVRGILEPAGLTLEELARPSVMESYRKLNAPPPVQDAAQPLPPSSAGVPRPPLSVFQDAPIEENKQNREVELQHFNPLSLDRESSSSSASTDSFRTAYAQSFASAHSMDDITTPRSLGSARSRNASAASTPSKTPGKRPNMMVGGAPGRPEHLVNGHDPAYSMEQNRAGMTEPFPGFWRDTRTDGAAEAGLSAAAATSAGVAAGAAVSELRQGSSQGLDPLSPAPLPDTVSSTKHAKQSADAPQPAEEKEASADPDAQHMERGASLLSRPEAEDIDQTTDEPGQQGRSEHDLSVATGYTGRRGLVQHARGMSGQQAIHALLQAQRTGGTVAPEVRFAAASALASGAADIKRKRDAQQAAQNTGQEQGVQASVDSQGAQVTNMADETTTEHGDASPPKGAGLLQIQPNTPHTYRINSEFYRASSNEAAGAVAPATADEQGNVRPLMEDSAREDSVDNDAAVPSPRAYGPESSIQHTAGGERHAEAHSGSSSKAAGLVESQAELEGEEAPVEDRSGSWLGWLGWTRPSDSSKADAYSGAERGEAPQSAAAAASQPSHEVVPPGHAASKPTQEAPVHAPAGSSPAQEVSLASAPASEPAQQSSLQSHAASSPKQATSKDACAAQNSPQDPSYSASALPPDDASHSGHAGDADEPITPERPEGPMRLIDRGSTAQRGHALAEPPNLQPIAALPVSASEEGSSAEGSVAHKPAYAEPSADISYCSFYREQPQPESTGSAVGDSAAMAAQPSSGAVSRAPESGQLSGDHAADPAGEKATALLTAAAASLSAPTKATRHPDASPTAAGGPQQVSSMGEETGQCPADGTSAASRAQEALRALSGTGPAESQQPMATPFTFTGTDSASAPGTPNAPTRSARKRSGRRISQPSSVSPRYGANTPKDQGSFFGPGPGRRAAEEEDTSPRSRAMSRYLSGRQSSSAQTSPAASRASTPDKGRSRSDRAELHAAKAPAHTPADGDTSPPRLRRKRTPKELAEEFRGHGLKQASWAPIPIYWAKDGARHDAPPADP